MGFTLTLSYSARRFIDVLNVGKGNIE